MRYPEIIFIHPMIRYYRLDTYNHIHQAFPGKIYFLFTNSATVKDPHYLLPAVKQEVANCLNNFFAPYHLCREFRSHLTPNNFTFDLLPPLLDPKTRVILFSSMTSIPVLLYLLLARILGKKIVLFEESWHYQNGIPFYRLLKPWIRFLLRLVDRVITAGSASAGMMNREMGVPRRKISVAINSAVPLRLPSAVPPEITNLFHSLRHSGDRIILYLGRMVAYKGLDLLIRAVAGMEGKNRVRLLAVGGGPFEAPCRVLAEELLPGRVAFLGSQPPENVPFFYALSDLFVLPSRFKEEDPVNCESWGFVINEVMALGKPVLTTTAVGAAFDLIDDGVTGFLVPEGDWRGLGKRLDQIIFDLPLLQRVGECAQARINQIARPDLSARVYIRAIHDVLKKRG